MTLQVEIDHIEKDLMVLKDVSLSRQNIDAIMQSLGEMIGIEDEEGFALDDDGIAELVIDDDIEMTILHLPHLPGVVVAVPMPEGTESHSEVLRYALKMNMNWMNVEGGCFTFVDPHLAIAKFIPLHQGGAAKLDRELARFVEKCKQWKTLLANMAKQQPPNQADQQYEQEECVGLRV